MGSEDKLSDAVLERFRGAQEASGAVLRGVVSGSLLRPTVAEFCVAVDEAIVASGGSKKIKMGVSMPCQANPGSVLTGYRGAGDGLPTALEGPMTLEWGAQLDGCASVFSLGVRISDGKVQALQTRAHEACLVAARVALGAMQAKKPASVVLAALPKIAGWFGLSVVPWLRSREIKQGVFEGAEYFETGPQKYKPKDFTFREGAYLMRVGFCSDDVKPTEKAFLWRRQAENSYILKTEAGRALMSSVDPVFPFALNNPTSAQTLGLKDALGHDLIAPERCLYSKAGEGCVLSFVAMLLPSGKLKLCSPLLDDASDALRCQVTLPDELKADKELYSLYGQGRSLGTGTFAKC